MVNLPFRKHKSPRTNGATSNQMAATVEQPHADESLDGSQDARTSPVHYTETEPSRWQLHRATRTRKTFALLTSFCLFVSLIFLIMVEIGSTYNKSVLRNIWFLKLDLSEVVPESVPNSVLLNTIAQTLGLHDFYQVGLWGFCQGYLYDGVTGCSKPKTLYWFNPVAILRDELLAGATIALPSDITDALHLIRLASRWMFAFFLTGACLTTVLIFLVPLALYSRWAAFATGIFTLINAILVTIACVLATVMFIIMRNVFTGASEVNIGAKLGTTMFVLMWIAAGFSIVAWLIQTSLCCCCASRRDIKTGKKRGNKHAWDANATPSEKPRKGWFGFRRR